ncbi:MAG: hypothetical protein KKD29_06735 [Candidatus Omnitrophica bacterium]|nr:hypothetical protein [Candidatus Omnitrophota bacterium]
MRKIIIVAIMSLIALTVSCIFIVYSYAGEEGEGFLLVKDDVILYKTKDCKEPKYEVSPYKFAFGVVEKKENGKILANIKGSLLGQRVNNKYQLIGCWGWIDEDDVILYNFSNVNEFRDKAIRIYLKKYFP